MRSLLALAVFTSVAAADPKSAVAHYTVRVVTTTKTGATVYVPVGEITRTNAGVTAKGLAAPELDKLADQLVSEWHAYKPPAQISISDAIYSDTGMHPSLDKHTFVFTAKDALYQAAALRHFAELHNYSVLGMSSVRFVEFDSVPVTPRGVRDEADRHTNFRKGTQLDFSGGYDSFFISVKVRTPSDKNRASASDPRLTIGRHNDEGTLQLAWMKLYRDGHWDVIVQHAGDVFVSAFGTFTPSEQKVPVIDHGEWKNLAVAKTSPLQLEAQLVENLEERELYDIEPAIDPALFR